MIKKKAEDPFDTFMPQIADLNLVKWKVGIENTCVSFPTIKYKNNQKNWLVGQIFLNKELGEGLLNFKPVLTVQLLRAFQS